jgi:hypothetical protein
MMIQDLHVLLRDALRTPEALAILTKHGPSGYDRGGCLVLACVLRTLLGGQLRGVTGYAERDPLRRECTDHYALWLGGLFLDVDGVQSAEELCTSCYAKWRVVTTRFTLAHRPRQDQVLRTRTFYMHACEVELEAYLRRALAACLPLATPHS